MKENILHMKLYLQMQELKCVLQMPFLDSICDEVSSVLLELEDKVMDSRVHMVVVEENQTVTNLLKERYLYHEKSRHSFLERNHIDLLQPATMKLPDEGIDFIVFVISSEASLKRTMFEIEKAGKTNAMPAVLVLRDRDSYEGRQRISLKCLDFSSSKAIDAQKFMDNQLMQESNFFSVKVQIEKSIAGVLQETVTPGYIFSYIHLLEKCKGELERQVQIQKQEKIKLQKMKERLENITVEFGEGIREKCISSCRVDCQEISFELKPDSTIAARKLVTEKVNEIIEKNANPQAAAIIEENLNMAEAKYNDFFKELIQELFWMSMEEKNRLSSQYLPVCMEEKYFRFSYFAMNINDFSPVLSTMDIAEVKRIMDDALNQTLYRYNLRLHYDIQKWLGKLEDKFCSRADQFLNAMKESVDGSLREHDALIDTILYSETYRAVSRLISAADMLDSGSNDQREKDSL